MLHLCPFRGLLARCAGSEVLKSFYNVVEGLRNSFGALFDHLPEWLQGIISYDRDSVDDEVERQVWSTLKVHPTWIQDFVDVAPLWEGGRLHVRESLKLDPNAFEIASQLQ